MGWFVRWFLFFFFQAEDGIRDDLVTGVQTCALPISLSGILTGVILQVSRAAGETAPVMFTGVAFFRLVQEGNLAGYSLFKPCMALSKIGRASCRERV